MLSQLLFAAISGTPDAWSDLCLMQHRWTKNARWGEFPSDGIRYCLPTWKYLSFDFDVFLSSSIIVKPFLLPSRSLVAWEVAEGWLVKISKRAHFLWFPLSSLGCSNFQLIIQQGALHVYLEGLWTWHNQENAQLTASSSQDAVQQDQNPQLVKNDWSSKIVISILERTWRGVWGPLLLFHSIHSPPIQSSLLLQSKVVKNMDVELYNFLFRSRLARGYNRKHIVCL